MVRSLFFVPANRVDLVRKLARFDADCSVLDLEDGTPPGEKDGARAGLAEAVAAVRADGYRGQILVRVNDPKSRSYLADIEAALSADADGVLIPKLESRDELFPVQSMLSRFAAEQPGRRDQSIAAGIESVRGVLDAVSLCAADPRLTLAYFGAEDFAADMGAVRTERGDEVLYARSQVVMAARAAGIVAIDQAVAEVRNDDLFRRDAQAGRHLGYDGKICVIPRQLPLCHEAFSPSGAQVAAARRVLAAYEQALSSHHGTLEFEGRLIDGPMLRQARRTIAVAELMTRTGRAA